MIELDPDQLPEGEEVLGILRQERSQLNTWVNVSVRGYETIYEFGTIGWLFIYINFKHILSIHLGRLLQAGQNPRFY